MSSIPDTGSVNLWDQVWAKVNAVLGEGGKMQLIYPFMDWTWPVPNPGYIDKTAYSVLGQIPKWSAVGKYAPSDKSLYDSYKNMINTCPKLVLTPEQREQLKEVQDQINEAQTTFTSNTKAKNYDWVQAQKVPPGVPPPQYAEWMVSSGWKATLDADSLAVQTAANNKAEIVRQQNANYSSAIQKAAMPTSEYDKKAGFLNCSVSGNDEWRPAFITNQGQDWIAQLTQGGGSPLHIEINASRASHAMKESWAGGAADYGGSFFGIYIDGSWHDMKLTESDLDVNVSIDIQAVTQVPVRAGEWYDSGYLSILAEKQQWNPPFTTQGGQSPVFGQGGLLPLAISSLIAGYKVSFRISMSKNTYDRHVSDFRSSGGIRIGPFHLGGGYSTHSDTWNKSTDGTTFSGTSTARYPFIIGFMVAEPGLSDS